LKPEVLKEQLEEQFKQFGELVSVAVKDFTFNAKPVKYGFVAFKTIPEAAKAKDEAEKVVEIQALF